MNRFVAGRRAEGRALHPRYYAMHPQEAPKRGARGDYVGADGITYRVGPRGDDGRQALDFRLPTTFTAALYEAHPPGSRLVLYGQRAGVEDTVVTIDGYEYMGPRQRSGRMYVVGALPGEVTGR